MRTFPISFKEANRQVGWILLVGVALSFANFALGVWPTLGQSLVQQVIISLVIGYSLLLIVHNSAAYLSGNTAHYQQIGLLVLWFSLAGVIGSEVDLLVRRFAFQQGEYQFLAGGGIYLFNAILSTVLGFSMLARSRSGHKTPAEQQDSSSTEMLFSERLKKIPLRRGETITLHPIQEVIYFEAYDNYSFLYDTDGQKHLCNYSLSFLEKRLTERFVRVHRKYLVNLDQIARIRPHLKGRYVIDFRGKQSSSITSSTSYAEAIRSIIKL